MVFVLRHPVNRLISWYNFARVNGLISSQTTFETYILTQQNTTDTNKPQHLRALEQGLYSSFAEQYLNIFGKNAVLIVFYEDLVSNPKQFCSDIAGFAGIDENYFRNFDFKIFNKTVPAKSVNAHRLFRKIKRAIRPVTRIFNASIRKKLKLAGHNLESRFQDANKNEDLSDVSLSADMLQYLENFYKSDKIKLQQLTGKIVPW